MSATTESGSLSFDRAAGFYDTTRTIPPEAMRALETTLVEHLRNRGRCLEVGVGTGRIALPLHQAGIDITGIDLSKLMLDKLAAKIADGTLLPLAIGDATALPFADDSFGAALAIHVLHLVTSWDRIAIEMARVVRPGGLLLFDIGHADRSRRGGWMEPASTIGERFSAEAGVERPHPGITAIADLDRVLADVGARGWDLEPIVGRMQISIEMLIQLFEHAIFTSTWSLDEEARRRAAEAVRPWAAERYGDLETPRELEIVVALRAYELPG